MLCNGILQDTRKKILKAFLGEEKKEEFFGPCEG